VAVLRERNPCNASSSYDADHRARNSSAHYHRRNNNNNNNSNDNDNRLIPSSASAIAADAGDSVTVATPDVAMGDGVRGLFDAAHGVVVEEYANVGRTTDALGGAIPVNSSGPETKSNNCSSVPPPSYFDNDSYAERLLEIAHIFHFVSIAILGIFVIQVRRSQSR